MVVDCYLKMHHAADNSETNSCEFHLIDTWHVISLILFCGFYIKLVMQIDEFILFVCYPNTRLKISGCRILNHLHFYNYIL